MTQPAEDLETVALDESQPDRYVRIGTMLNATLRAEFIQFLRRNSEVFAWSYNDMPGISPDIISHKLSISPAFKPIRQKPRSYDAERYEAMKNEVDKLMTIGFIREAVYPDWLANSVMVWKAKGGWRMFQDYTDLNKACPKDSFPLPRIDELVDATAGHELLSFMDAYSGYNQIFMHPADSEHKAFITDKGLYCYNVMPFGLKNAGATYQRLVNRIFAEQIGSTMEVYVDDMLVKSRTADEHLADLAIMFGILKDYRMRLNPTKCAFGVSSGRFLGFMISQRGIEANPDKIKAIIDMEVPKTQKDIQSLTGRVTSRATDKCAPFFKALIGGKHHIEWTAECDKAFQDLKDYIGKAPLLSKPLPGEFLFLYLSVSNTAVSSLALALVVSARRLQPYFQAHTIVVLTNQPLRQVFQKPETSGRLVKWAIELGEFDVQFKPRPAEKGQAVADFIAELTPSEASEPGKTPPPEGLPNGSRLDQSIPICILHVDGSANQQGCGAGLVLTAPDGAKMEYAIRFSFRTSNNEAEYEALLAGLRLAKSMGTKQVSIHSDSQLFVNQVTADFAAKDASMTAYLSSAHLLLQQFKAYEIRQVLRSENSHADALARLASAINDKIGRKVPVEILAQPSTTSVGICTIQYEDTWMSPIYIYLTNGTLPKDKSQARKLRYRSARYIVINDILYKRGYTTSYMKCVTEEQGKYVLREIHSGVCGDHSGSRSLAHKAFRQGYYWSSMYRDAIAMVKKCDKCQRQFCTRLKINLFFASPAHPQSNGQVEAVNKIIKKLLKRQLNSAKGAWPEKLPEALWAIRMSYRTSTGETPFSLAFGSEVVVPVEIGESSYRTEVFEPKANEAALALSLDLIEERRTAANLRNEAYKQRVSWYYDSRVKPRSFRIGDWVMRKVSLATKNPTEGILGPSWEGPYEVIGILRSSTYKLRGTDGKTLGHP
ncbi:uncharacterized protein LOC110755796 [Prunus avium]|uniref:Uncharacterized protein LOC110755796 n=1 Tax=Prunus avium TaxID=42229 RepID=A0A6P5SG49_PRUAV|nr:uncharacterized protein LOC110755796 [Prunus avium]